MPARWPETTIRLCPLHYDQVNKLLDQTLGSLPDVELTTAVLMKSGGNPRLAVRIAQSAELSMQLVLHDGQLSMSGHTLWNEYIQSTVQELLHGLSADEWMGLHTLSAVEARPPGSPMQTVEAGILDRLEMRGLVALTEDSSGAMWVSVSPHIVVDHFRDLQVRSSLRVLADRMSREIDSHDRPIKSSSPELLAELIRDLRSEARGGTAPTRHFQEQLRELEESQFGVWEFEKTMSNTAAFLKFYWGGPIDPSRIEQVFSETEAVGADSGDHFFFALTRALWAIVSGGEASVATGILKAIGQAHPDWRAEAQAFALYLEASFDRMPVRGLALHIAGHGEEAVIFSLSQRAAARRRLDQFGFVASSYVAVLAMTQQGLSKEADCVMTGVFALGRPGFLVSFLHDAMLRIAGLRTLAGPGKNAASLGIQARKNVADIDPLPGTGKAVYELVTRKYADPSDFD